jgi:hypothetical protein
MGAPKDNNNAEVWTVDEARDLFIKAKSISKDITTYNTSNGLVDGYKYHYIGEVAAEFDSYSDVFKYLKSKFSELMPLYNSLKTRLEANCFSDSKKGIIKEATAIMNLKSNYGWTDRVDNTTQGAPINPTLTKEDISNIIDKL